MARDVMEEIRKEVADNKVVIYMKGTKEMPRCGFSAAAVGVLQEYGVPIKDINVLEDQEKWAGVKQFSDWPTIPQIFIDGQFVGGCDILREMHAKGELQPLIKKAVGLP
ncbi:MAG TPA: Grx4 family monothiol glutaredoxin [Candidatus Polarisedimenticolia bacterium]